jgi:hypothetical protein
MVSIIFRLHGCYNLLKLLNRILNSAQFFFDGLIQKRFEFID